MFIPKSCILYSIKYILPNLDCIQKYYQKYAFPSCKSTPIILASLGNDAGIYGAARMVIKD